MGLVSETVQKRCLLRMLCARALSRLGRAGLTTSTSPPSSTSPFRGIVTSPTSPIIAPAASRSLLTSAASASWFGESHGLSKEETENKAFSAVLGKDQYVYRLVTDHVIPRWG